MNVLDLLNYGSIVVGSLIVAIVGLHLMRANSHNKKLATFTWLLLILINLAALFYVFYLR